MLIFDEHKDKVEKPRFSQFLLTRKDVLKMSYGVALWSYR